MKTARTGSAAACALENRCAGPSLAHAQGVDDRPRSVQSRQPVVQVVRRHREERRAVEIEFVRSALRAASDHAEGLTMLRLCLTPNASPASTHRRVKVLGTRASVSLDGTVPRHSMHTKGADAWAASERSI